MSASLQAEHGPAAKHHWKILLVSSNCCVTPEPVFPLGLAHLATALRDAGCDVEWLDLLADQNGLEKRLLETNPDLVGISVRNIDDVLIRRQETFIENLGSLVEMIHQRLGCPVVLGGSGFSILPREMLELAAADFGVIGEGELALTALIEALRTGSAMQGIKGLVYRRDNKVVVNDRDRCFAGHQTRAADVPAHVAEYYLRHGGILNVQTQRGCAHRCCYCTYPVIEGARHRRRAAEEVVAEFERIESLGARYAFVVDSVFNSSVAHVTEVCEALARKNLKIRWGCFLRPEGLDREMMRLMAQAGLAHIEFGSDSFCDETLRAYQKDFTFEDIRRSTELFPECAFIPAHPFSSAPKPRGSCNRRQTCLNRRITWLLA